MLRLSSLLLLLHGAAALQLPWTLQVPLFTPGTLNTAQVEHHHDGKSATQSPKYALTADIFAFGERLLKERHVPGISVGVVQLNGDSVIAEFGTWGNMTEDGDAVKPETLFSIGSCSKAFVASAMGILMDDFATGRNVTALPPSVSSFTWDTKVQDLLPEDWVLDQGWTTKKANLRDLLGHLTGLTRHDGSYHRNDTTLDIIRRMRHLKTKYELRQKWAYNNIMFFVGAHIISVYSGMPFRDFVHERIFTPLNMSSTTYHGQEAEESGWFSQAWSGEGRRIPYWMQDESVSEWVAGAGGVISNTFDMTRWIATLLNKGVDPRNNRTIIPRSTYDEMTTAQSIVLGLTINPLVSIIGYGMGWLRSSYAGHDMIGHGGGLPGFLTDVSLFPNDGFGLVTFTNADGLHAAQSLLPTRIIEDYLGLNHSFELPNPDPGSLPLAQWALRPHFAPTSRPQPMNRTQVLAESELDVPIERFTGEYFDPGYGGITLCAPASTSLRCKKILHDWRAASANRTLDPDTLYCGSTQFWQSHMKVRRTRTTTSRGSSSGSHRQRSEVFVGSTGTVFPHGYGRDSTPFVYTLLPPGMQELVLECVVDGRLGEVVGCGLMNIEEGPAGAGDTVPERADVFFRKVESF